MACNTVVIDNGSYSCKTGLAGNDNPSVEVPTITGRLREKGFEGILGESKVYVGEEAMSKKGLLNLDYPIQNGVIVNFDDIEKIWNSIFCEELRLDPRTCAVLLTDTDSCPRAVRSKMTEIMFEKFQVKAVYVSQQSQLALYTTGRVTGTVLNCGDNVSSAVPIFEGYALPHAIKKSDFSGRDVTDYLMKLLNSSGHSFSTIAEREIVRDIKETMCRVREKQPQKYQKDQHTSPHAENNVYKMPDGNELKLGDEILQCPEGLFDPSLCGSDSQGLHNIVRECIRSCDCDITTDLYQNIILTGGTTCLPGLPKRFEEEFKSVIPSCLPFKVIADENRKYGAWIGGSILASLQTFGSMWITRPEYDASGPDVVHRKCS